MRSRWTIFISVIGILVTQGAWAQTYVTPTDPLGGTTVAPLNSSASIQTTQGSLVIGDVGRSSVLCLNATTGADPLATTDTNNCISAWNQVANSTGQYVRLSSSGACDPDYDPTAAPCLDPNRYLKQVGYVHIRGRSDETVTPKIRHGFTTVAESPLVCDNPTGGQGDGRCQNTGGQICSYNIDCLPASDVNTDITTAALYATDGGVAANYAGYFSGKFYIQPGDGKLCLNGLTGTSCVTRWSDVTAIGTNKYLKLQTAVTPTIQAGSASLTGVAWTGSAIAGSLDSDASMRCSGPTCRTCGDGYCASGSGETSAICPVDCETVSTLAKTPVASPYVPFTATGGTNKITLSFKTTSVSAGPASGKVWVLITRSSADETFLFTPKDGSTYSVGGDSYFAVVYSGQVNANTTVQFDDVGYGLPVEQTVYYRAFQGNAYPRWSAVSTASAEAQIQIVNPPPRRPPPVGGG